MLRVGQAASNLCWPTRGVVLIVECDSVSAIAYGRHVSGEVVAVVYGERRNGSRTVQGSALLVDRRATDRIVTEKGRAHGTGTIGRGLRGLSPEGI